MKSTKFIVAIISLLLSAQLLAQKKITPLTIGESITIDSKILQEDRVLNIYLPHGYSPDSAKTYPVVYLLDGSMDEDFIHVAGAVQFGSFSWINMLPASIVVGIANIDRKRDFTYPTRNELDKKYLPTGGGAAKFIQFLSAEVQPFITKQYKTDTISTLIGQSLGGLLATEILFKQPDLFDNYVIVSPSLWWDEESLLQSEPTDYTANKSVYVAVGKEGAVMERLARALHVKLATLQKKNTRLFFKFLENQDHGDALHLAVYDAFEKIFSFTKQLEKEK